MSQIFRRNLLPTMVAYLLGGIGLFLLGMILMTDGLKTFAGDALRRVLAKMTGGLGIAVFSGAAVTAVVQSSSATTLATIGFVSAGLLTFTQAIGVILGASVGTTTTGWLVSLLGLKFSISAVALPFVGCGALLNLLAKSRFKALGLSIAGFGLIFVGIDTLQVGMEGLAQRMDPSAFPRTGYLGRLLLVLVGIGMTVVMQSSSAAVATTLAALHSGAVDMQQAAALVIGQNTGTTVTAAIASLGASVPARRTALAHILFNSMCGVLAFVSMPVLLSWTAALMAGVTESTTAGLAAFHTAFVAVGVILVAPFVPAFSRAIRRMIPERQRLLTPYLDHSVTHIAAVALESARRGTCVVAAAVFRALRARLNAIKPGLASAAQEEQQDIQVAIDELRRFLSVVQVGPESRKEQEVYLAILHALDHLESLLQVMAKSVEFGHADPLVQNVAAAMAQTWDGCLSGLSGAEQELSLPQLAQRAAEIETAVSEGRRGILRATAGGNLSALAANRQIELLRWLREASHHTWRTMHYLVPKDLESVPEPASVVDAGDEIKMGA